MKGKTTVLGAVTALIFLPAALAHAGFVFYGISGSFRPDLVQIDGSATVETPVGNTGAWSGMNSLAIDAAGANLYSVSAANRSSSRLVRIDPLTGAGTGLSTVALAGQSTVDVRGLAFSPGALYALHVADSGSGSVQSLVYSLDLGTGAGTLVGNTTLGALDSLAYGNGRLWSYDGVAKDGAGLGLISIDPVTAAYTDVNGLNDGRLGIVEMSFAPNGNLYAATKNELYQVNTTTGAFTLIGSSQGDLHGLAAVPEPATIAIWSVGLLCAGLYWRRRRAAA